MLFYFIFTMIRIYIGILLKVLAINSMLCALTGSIQCTTAAASFGSGHRRVYFSIVHLNRL